MRTLLTVLVLLLPGGAAACGPDSDCKLQDRRYRIQLPENAADGVPGAIIFAHGYRGSAAGTLRSQGLRRLAASLGVALVAPQSADVDWMIPGVPQNPSVDGAAELSYFDALIGALRTRHSVDTARLMMSGFSAGGMMTWFLACHRGERFAGFVPVAGTFWAPLPDDCPSPVPHLLHIHGSADRIVPLTGRPIRTTRQGSVFDALALFAAAGRFGDARPRAADPALGLRCQGRLNESGTLLEFCTHDGGHSFSASYLRRAWQTLRDLGAL